MADQECSPRWTRDNPRVSALARMPRLLIASDYDGTLAPLVDDPMQAYPRRESVVAMRTLAELPQTDVAVISGRALRDLAALSRLPEEIRLVGSHGGEFDVDFSNGLSPAQTELRNTLSSLAEQLTADVPGCQIERKPAGLAVHFRTVDPGFVSDAQERLMREIGDLEGVAVRRGHNVIDFAVYETDKGRALQELRHQLGATAVLYVGDDLTDEDAFATLSGPDVGIKVGRDASCAELRVEDPEVVSQLLAALAEERGEWLMGSGAVPIEA